MTSSLTRFGVLAYGGDPRLYREAAVAVLTVEAHRPTHAELVVLTDRPAAYQWLGGLATIERLSPATITEWQGPTRDRYRPKIAALRRLAADGLAHVVLFDGDTMARRDLGPLVDRLESGALFLYRREYALAASRRGDRRLRHEVLGRMWDGITAGPSSAMWNGGVIASSRQHVGVFDRTLTVFDEMRQKSGHFAVEQLAYSIVFPAYGAVEEAAPWFDHYWANRGWFDRAIERFLSDARLTGLTVQEAVEHLRQHPIIGPLDGRVAWWRTRLQRLLTVAGSAGRDEDREPNLPVEPDKL